MSIVESSRSTSGRSKVKSLASLALMSSAVFVAAPKAAHASMTLLSTGDLSWFNTSIWASGTTTGVLPESGGNALTAGIINLDANNATLPATGVLFDPGTQISNSSYKAKLQTTANVGTFYISNSNTSSTETSAPNSLTVLSGTLENWAWTIGRDNKAQVVQNGGTIISDGKFSISSSDSQIADGSLTPGSGTYFYHGGTLVVKNQVQVAGGAGGTFADPTAQVVGKWTIYNDGADGALQVANSVKFAGNSAGTGSVGIVEFHYDLNTHGTGDVRPVQANVNTTNSQLNLNNVTGVTASELNLVLDTAPSTIAGNTQNLGLFKENTITGAGTFPKIFYATDGLTGYTQGATISAVVGGTSYSWTISYSGVIAFSNTATSAYSVTSAVGGNDVVLIGAAVPEPTTMALLGGAGSLILARRRRKA